MLDHVDSERSKEDEWLLNSVSFRSDAYDAAFSSVAYPAIGDGGATRAA